MSNTYDERSTRNVATRVSTDRKYKNGGLSLEIRQVENRNRNNFWREGIVTRFERLSHIFEHADWDMTPADSSKQPDVGRHPKLNITSGFCGQYFLFFIYVIPKLTDQCTKVVRSICAPRLGGVASSGWYC